MDLNMPEQARCLGCGYSLRGLETPVCPECGREFDPQDTRTFDANPARRQRKKWIKRLALVLGGIALVYILYPRGTMTYSISFTCQSCGASTIIKRWQPKQPKWVPILYPGWRWPLGDSTPEPTAGCPGHRYDIVVDLKVGASGSGAFGKGAENDTENVYVNDHRAIPANGPTILKSMAKIEGFSIGPKPAAEQK
jgi:predicted RNA-binding Zn-ribbon protein involved in translation (DUF1610 family)